MCRRGEEVRNDEAGQQFDELRGSGAIDKGLGFRGEEQAGHTDDARQAFHGEVAQRLARFGGEHKREVTVVAQ